MTASKFPRGRKFVTLALGLGVMALAGHGSEDGMKAQAGDGSVRCEIQVKELRGGVQLQGVVYSDRAVSGDYQLQVSQSGGSGSSKINQGGGFDVRPNAPAKLGVIQLGGDGGSYRAKLKVMWNGEEIECVKKAGGGWL